MPHPDPAEQARLVAGLEAIIDAAAGILAAESLADTLTGMAEALASIVEYTSLAVFEVDDDEQALTALFAIGLHVEQTLAARPSLDSSITGMAVRKREVVWLNSGDPMLDSHVMPGTPADEDEAFLVAPLLIEGRPVGTLNVWREVDHARFAPDEAVLLQRFAALAALAYQNAKQRDLLRGQALTDALTGVYNRRHFEERLAAELAAGRRHGTPTALLLLDVADFKAINDGHGHQAGDRALRDVAAVLRRDSRADDVVCRVGGEEFAVVLPRTDPAAVTEAGERLVAGIRAARLGPAGTLTISAGAATTDPGEDAAADDLYRRADERLLGAKAAGKDRLAGPTRSE